MKIHRMKLSVLLSFLLVVLTVNFSFAQEMTITGKVTDKSTGEVLPGVSVVVKGTTNGTATNLDGEYTFQSVPLDADLVFSFIGYKTFEVTASTALINVQLEEDIESLEEVVVVGYGIQKKREITGSIAKVENSKITDKIVPSFESALQGQAAGVSVTTGSGMAGSGSVVRIRGISSINAGGDPLYVIDGIPVTNDMFGLGGRTGGMNINPLAAINPNDIASVEVLKDAAAAGIYGSRGANGVILVTTRKGKVQKLSVNFNTKHSISNPAKKMNMTNAAEWLQLYKEAWENDGNTGIPQGLPGGMTWEQAQLNDTDWWDEVTRTGVKQEYNLSVTYGTEKFKIYAGGTFSDNQSYMIGNNMQRASGKLSVDYRFNEKYSVSLSSMLATSETNLPGNPWDGGLGAAMGYAIPIYPIYNTDGTYFNDAGWSGNPVMVNNLRKLSNKDIRTINNLTINANPLKNFNVTLTGAIDYLNFEHTGNEDPYLRSSDLWYKWENKKKVLNYNYSAVVSYNFELPDDHSLTLMGGHEYQRSETTGDDWNLEQNGEANTTELQPQEWSYISFFGRANYMYKDRYIAQTSLRTDGSSRFGKNNKYGYFPTIALGWIMTEEDFLKDNEIISFLKVKTSYGITGNSNIPNYEPLGTYRVPGESGYYNGNPVRYPERDPNPDLKWETTQSFDAGFEARFLDGRISTEFAYFYKLSSDVFINQATTATSGYGSQWQNLAEIMNTGVEFDITTRNTTGKFKWTTNFNISTLKNEVTDVGGLTTEVGGGTNDTRVIKGYPVGTNMLVRISRIDPTDGSPIYLDADGNETKIYKFEGADGYKVPVGKIFPDFTGGFTNTFEYKGFEMSALFIFSYGAKIYDSSAKRQLGLATDWNFRTDRFDRWRQPGDIAKYPRLSLDGSAWGKDGEVWFNSDMWLYDGDYLRLKNLTFSYNIHSKVLNKLHIKTAKIGVTATNLLTFTKYPGADPEIARDFDDARDRNMSVNVNYLNPPQERTFTFNLNVTF